MEFLFKCQLTCNQKHASLRSYYDQIGNIMVESQFRDIQIIDLKPKLNFIAKKN